MSRQTELTKEIIAVLRKYAERNNSGDYAYVNPHFLKELCESACEYGHQEDDIVDEWASNMWGA